MGQKFFSRLNFGKLVALAALTSFAPLSAEASVYYACVNKLIGTLRIVKPTANCLPIELAINWNQAGQQGPQGPQGPKGDAGPQGPQGQAGAGAIIVRDANGATVGTLLSQNSLVMKVGNQQLLFNNFQITGFQTTNSTSVVFYYATANCTGTRYLPAADLPRVALIDNAQTIHYSGDPAQTQSISSIETFSPGQPISQAGTCSPVLPAQSFIVGPVMTSPLPSFTPPFHL